jgi:hypothetical protein
LFDQASHTIETYGFADAVIEVAADPDLDNRVSLPS